MLLGMGPWEQPQGQSDKGMCGQTMSPCHGETMPCSPRKLWPMLSTPGFSRLTQIVCGPDNCKLSLWASLDNRALGILASTLVKQAG